MNIRKATIQDAEILGKAMRFGAMLSAHAPEKTGELSYDAVAQTLTFRLRQGSEALFGEVAVARFHALAEAPSARPLILTDSTAEPVEA